MSKRPAAVAVAAVAATAGAIELARAWKQAALLLSEAPYDAEFDSLCGEDFAEQRPAPLEDTMKRARRFRRGRNVEHGTQLAEMGKPETLRPPGGGD